MVDTILEESTCVFNKLSGLSISDGINSVELTRFSFIEFRTAELALSTKLVASHHTTARLRQERPIWQRSSLSEDARIQINFTGKKIPELAAKNGTNFCSEWKLLHTSRLAVKPQ